MTFADLKAKLRGLINRSDMTDDLAEDFIQQSQIRLERLLRLSFMQKFVSFTPPRADGVFRVPVDYLELIDLFTDHGEVARVDTSSYLRQPATQGIPRVFMQTGHDIRMRPFPSTSELMFLRYFGCEPKLVQETQTNQWTICAQDALLYGAAEYAADYFEDERLPRFASRFEQAVTELNDQQQQEDFSGPMSIAPAYSFPSETF
jgi:hypothetical protein